VAKRHAVLFGAIALAGAGLDLLTKTLALSQVRHHGELPVIRGFFSIGHEYNPGVIWSFGPGAKTLWLVISIVAMPLIAAIFLRSRKTWTTTICLGMIEAGTIGNCWDRIFHPGVRDFIKFFYVQANGLEKVWPLFNLADSCIVVGAILLSVEMFFFEPKKPKTELPAPQTSLPADPPPL
jgi:signal peptidase II